MEKLKSIVRKHQERIIIMIQVVLCTFFAGNVIRKEIRQKLRFSEKIAKKEAKQSGKLKKQVLKDAKRLARAEYKVKLAKVKLRTKRDKVAGGLVLRKYKDKLKKKKSKKS